MFKSKEIHVLTAMLGCLVMLGCLAEILRRIYKMFKSKEIHVLTVGTQNSYRGASSIVPKRFTAGQLKGLKLITELSIKRGNHE